jgi:O-antigen/teichoic acid export membrane protein
MGIMGLVWAVVIASVVSAGLLLARFWMLSKKGLGLKQPR